MQAFYGRLKFSIPSNGTANDCILIWGASTACGHQAVQFARLAGLQDKHNITVLTAVTLLTIAKLEVIATASSRNHAALLALGATACEDYKDPRHRLKAESRSRRKPHRVCNRLCRHRWQLRPRRCCREDT